MMLGLTVGGALERFFKGLSTYSRELGFAVPCIPHGAAYVSVARNSERIVIAVFIFVRRCDRLYHFVIAVEEQKGETPAREGGSTTDHPLLPS